jgi:hypothetical protein
MVWGAIALGCEIEATIIQPAHLQRNYLPIDDYDFESLQLLAGVSGVDWDS